MHRVFHGIRFKVNKRLVVEMTTFFFLCLPIPERGQINEWTILFWSVEGSFFSYFYSLFANKVKNQVRRIGKVVYICK